MQRTLLIFSIAALLCMTTLAAPAMAATITVPDDYSSIQAAIDAASSGDTVLIRSGVYTLSSEQIMIRDKSDLTITGEDRDSVIIESGDSGDECCYFTLRTGAHRTRLENITFTNMKVHVDPGSSYNIIANDVFLNPTHDMGGLEISSEYNIIRDNVISGATGDYSGVTLSGNSNVFENNSIRDGSSAGLTILCGENNTITKNSFINNTYAGIEIYSDGFGDVENNRIYLNTITGNDVPVTTTSTTPPTTIFWVSPEAITYTYNGTSYSGVMGNYWDSDYTGADDDGDGIGDTPYTLPEGLGNDTAPLMAPFGNYGSTLSTITVSPATADLTVGGTQQFAAVAKDQDDNEMTGVTFAWTSGNETVGTVNETGYFTALTAGTTTVTAAAEGVNGSATVTASVPACDLAITNGPLPSPGGAVFALEPNLVRMVVKNTGSEAATDIRVAIYASDVSDTVPVNVTIALTSLEAGTQTTVYVLDPTLREHEGGTVAYTAVLDPDNTIVETNETNNVVVGGTRSVLYNGYKGKIYWEGGSNVTTVRTYDLRGDIVHSFGNSQYMSGSFGSEGWTNYTVTWTGDDLPLPAGATVRDAWLYVPYCWDNTNAAPDNVSIDFNGVRVPYVNWYHDVSNFGAYRDYVYGLMTYNVTSLYQAGANNTALFARTGTDAKISPAGFTLAVVYEDASAARKQIFVNEEFDILGADQGNYGTSMEEATAYVPFSGATIDTGSVTRANLTTFVPWGNDGEGNLYFNGDRIGTGVWNYGPRAVGASDNPQVAVDDREVTAYLNATGNEAAVQGDNTWKSPCMVAAQTFLVVEYADGTAAPAANFTANVTAGEAPLAVQFTDLSTGSPTSWLWVFGDGTNATEQNPVHTYVTAGTFTVTLTATGPGGSDTETKADLIAVDAPLTSDSYNGGIPLTTVEEGTVSGGLWFDSYPGFATSAEKTFTLPAHTNITWARLYVDVYCGHMQNNYRGNVTIGIDADGNGTYELQKAETFDTTYSFPGDGGTGPVWLNDHMNRVTSDYIMWYDLTDAITGQTVNVQAASQKIDSSFDGRVKAMVLVVAYNDGDADEVRYWVNQGHDTVNPLDDTYTGSTTFGTASLAGGWNAADLSAIYLASVDGVYTLQGTTLASGTKYGPYFGNNTWDVSSVLTAGQNSTLGYDKSGENYYKLPLALMSVRYGGSSGGDAPVADFTADVTSGTAPLAVNFTDLSTNIPTLWAWDFGDNATSTEQNATHTYTAAGTYTVTLTATNAYGSDSEEKTGYVTVTAPAAQVDLTIAGTVNPVPASAVFAREPNPVKIVNVKNTGAAAAANITVALYASDVANGTVAINTTTVATLASGATSTVTVLDPTIRDLEGGTVTYTAVVDPDNRIAETDETNNNKSSAAKSVKYNGYKGKGIYWDGGSNITTQQTFDLRGGIVYAAQPAAAYKGVGWTDRTETWTADDLPVPAGATVEKVLLYVAYNWDQTEAGLPNLTATFNGNAVALGTPYLDKSNIGAYADYEYGLYPAVDVTSLFVRDGNNILVMTPNDGNKNALYPSTLVVVYSDPSATRKQIFLNEECDELGYSESGYGTTLDEATAYVPFTGMTIDPATVTNATLYSFVGSAGPDEGNLLFNGATVATNAWMGTASTCEAQAFDVTTLLTATENEAGIQGTTSGGMCAYHQFLVVEYADAALPDLTVSTLAPNNGEVFSNSDNTYTAKVTNIGTGDAAAFAVGFNVSGATGTVAVDGLAAGANTTVAWTDETVREAGEAAAIAVVADADGAIAEPNEENNLKTVEKTVVNNGYRGKRWTGGDDLNTTATYDIRGDLLWSAGDGAYLSAGTNWNDYTVNWTAGDLVVPEGATIAAARLYVPYTWDKGPVFPENVTLTFNDEAVAVGAYYADEKGWGTSYPYGMTVYDVAEQFSTDGNAAILASTFPGGGNVSVRGMLLAVVYDDGTTSPHTVIMNEGFDLLYGGAAQGTTPEQATAYAPFSIIDTADAVSATLITVAPGAGPTEGELIFNDQTWTNVWNYTGTSQIGVDERNVTSFLAGENVAAFQSSADYMEAAAAFLVVEYAPAPGSILITSTPAGAAVWLDGADTGLVTYCTLENVPAGDHVVTLKLDGYADASAPVTVVSGETATVDLALTTLTGSLAVTSTPTNATILIDGADTGKVTDATLDGIAVGTHTVVLRKDGYRDASAEIEIAYNQTTALHLDLVEAHGSITVASTPDGAAIWLDGEDTGLVTDCTLENVAAGEHTVTVKKAGYADASATVTVVDDGTAVAHFTLIEPAGSIVVTSTPDGAAIWLDGAETGETTDTTLTNVPVGDHTVRVELDGYLDTEETVTVTSGEIASVHFDLDASAIVLQPGWNFVSTPKRLADGQDTIAVFDGVDTDGRPVLLYNGTNQWEAMSSNEMFEPLDGIWIYANGTYEIPLAFAAASNSPPTTKYLDEGWNAIGFSDIIPEPAVTTLRSVETTWATLFGFNAAEQEYDASIIRGATGRHGEMRELSPFQGYWLYMNDADTLAAIGA